jgi:hypothetical protein
VVAALARVSRAGTQGHMQRLGFQRFGLGAATALNRAKTALGVWATPGVDVFWYTRHVHYTSVRTLLGIDP